MAPLGRRGHDGRARHEPNPLEALEVLREGNARFVAGRPQGCTHSPQERALLAGSQSPLAAVLACSDSRVPPELIFDSTLGQLFVIRLAGHAPGRLARASILFAVEQLAVPLVVVLGHQDCVAVQIALAGPAAPGEQTAISPVVEILAPALEPLLRERQSASPGAPPGSGILDQAVELNVRASLRDLSRQPAIAQRVSQNALVLAGGVYRLDSGLVDWLG